MSAPAPQPRKKPRPSTITVQPENIPEELRLRPNWVVARNKIPLMPDGRRASIADPNTWVNFASALAAYQNGVGDALWFALDGVPREDGLVLAAIDLDAVTSTQERHDAARGMLTSLNTYWEKSPSGNGLRAICWARPLPSGKNSDGIELYTSKRFVSITGAVVKGRRRITDCADKFEQLVPAPHGGIEGTPLPCTFVNNSALMAGLDSFPPLSLEDIRRAALAIPAEGWRERGDWWRLVSALASEAVGRPADADGLKQIMHAASSRPGAFEAAFGAAYDSAANDAQWEQALRDTQKRMSNGGRAVTLGTLLYEATSYGWAPENKLPTSAAIDVARFVVTNPDRWKMPPPRQWLVRPYLIRGNYTVISASGGQGKTTWSLALMLMASAGRAGMLPGELFGKLRCIYISAEDTADELRRRVLSFAWHGLWPSG